MSQLAGRARGAGRWLRQVAALVVKEWRQLLRDTALAGFVVFIFTVDILIAAGAPALDLQAAPIGLIDRDASTASRMYRSRSLWSCTTSIARPPSTYEGRTMTG